MPPENLQPALRQAQGKPTENFWKELFKLVLLAVVIVIPFRLYVAQPFIVDGLSMYPTFDNGHYLIIDEVSYRFREPARGDVLVFKAPPNPEKYYIKRLIGFPGETIMINDGQVTITNKENPDGLKLAEPYVKFPKDEVLTIILEENEYFVMGDNRASSSDSRVWGPLPKENIIGRPVMRFFPPALFPGDISHFEARLNANDE